MLHHISILSGNLNLSRTATVLMIALVSLSIPAGAWDTKEYEPKGVGEKDKWQSVYLCLDGSHEECAINEHELLSNRALALVSPDNPWLIGSQTDFYTLDMNAEIFRPELKGIGESKYITKHSELDLEQRLLPPIPHFAGLPDFSYTVYDWANKNQICPSLAENHQDVKNCHVFSEWHGARLNASHFGDQAVKSYKRMHNIALQLAKRARAMREAAEAKGDATVEYHKDAIREAEYLALMYEASGQHFLSDRWATGHMFDRWGAPELLAGEYDDPELMQLAGALTGILHGHQSFTNQHDPLSSPTWKTIKPTDDKETIELVIPEWRFPRGDRTYPGVGDYRLSDMEVKEYTTSFYSGQSQTFDFVTSLYLGENRTFDLPVDTQEEWILDCLSSGYYEVIDSFGGEDLKYGIDEVELDFQGSYKPHEMCFRPRVTNKAMLQGWDQPLLSSFLLEDGNTIFATARIYILGETLDNLSRSVMNYYGMGPKERASISSFSSNLLIQAGRDPNGIGIAEGGIGNLGDIKTGNNYPIASYFEPQDITKLSDTLHPRGKDKQAVFGLFNRAGADFMCEKSPEILETLRGSSKTEDRALCRVLAGRLYRGTKTDYEGPQKERASVDFEIDKTEVSPLCDIVPEVFAEKSFEPRRLPAGYVGWGQAYDGEEKAIGPYAAGEKRITNQSVSNWCDKIPVLHLLPELMDQENDIVGRVSGANHLVTLNGDGLGNEQGRLLLGADRKNAVSVSDIVSWTDDRIQFRLGDLYDSLPFEDAGLKMEPEARVIYAFIDRVPGNDEIPDSQKSLGRFGLLDQGPQVVGLKIQQSAETLLNYERALNQDGVRDAVGTYSTFTPIAPGQAKVSVVFDTDMDIETYRLEARIGSIIIDLTPETPTLWTGDLDIPEGLQYEVLVGYHDVRVILRAPNQPLRSISSAAAQTNESSLFALIDQTPIYLQRVAINGPEGLIYDAVWQESEISSDDRGGRVLNVTTRLKAPEDGKGTLSLTFSDHLDKRPDVRLGGRAVFMKENDGRWTGVIDFTTLSELPIASKVYDIIVGIEDWSAKGLDADPRSASKLPDPPEKIKSPVWRGYEAQKFGGPTLIGGADKWHYISAADTIEPADLEGLWASRDYNCGTDRGLFEEARVKAFGHRLMAVKTIGDPCIGAGQETWGGFLDRDKILGFVNQLEDNDRRDILSIPSTIDVISADELIIIPNDGSTRMTFKRVSPASD